MIVWYPAKCVCGWEGSFRDLIHQDLLGNRGWRFMELIEDLEGRPERSKEAFSFEPQTKRGIFGIRYKVRPPERAITRFAELEGAICPFCYLSKPASLALTLVGYSGPRDNPYIIAFCEECRRYYKAW